MLTPVIEVMSLTAPPTLIYPPKMTALEKVVFLILFLLFFLLLVFLCFLCYKFGLRLGLHIFAMWG